MVSFTLDPIPLTNFVLATAIFALGLWGYHKSGRQTEALVGVAFGLFAITHFLTLLGTSTTDLPILIVRIVGYVIVMYAMLRVAAGHTYG
jgi:hydrogenase/urease accessory protein HupE